MIYVQRDDQQNIIAIYNHEQENATEQLAPQDPAVAAFLFDAQPESDLGQPMTLLYLQELHLKNRELTGTMDELLDTLVQKQIITSADLPEVALQRLHERRHAAHDDMQKLSSTVEAALQLDE